MLAEQYRMNLRIYVTLWRYYICLRFAYVLRIPSHLGQVSEKSRICNLKVLVGSKSPVKLGKACPKSELLHGAELGQKQNCGIQSLHLHPCNVVAPVTL